MISPLFQIFLFCTQREKKTKIQSQKFLFPAVFFLKSCWCFFPVCVLRNSTRTKTGGILCVKKRGGKGWGMDLCSGQQLIAEWGRETYTSAGSFWSTVAFYTKCRRATQEPTRKHKLHGTAPGAHLHTHTHRADTLHSTTTTRWGPYIERKKAYRKRHTHTRSVNDMQSGDYRPLDFQRLIVLIIVFSSWYGASLK